jgi:hypothetical protein
VEAAAADAEAATVEFEVGADVEADVEADARRQRSWHAAVSFAAGTRTSSARW